MQSTEKNLKRVDYKVIKLAPEKSKSDSSDNASKVNTSKKVKKESKNDKAWELREHTHQLIALQKETRRSCPIFALLSISARLTGEGCNSHRQMPSLLEGS